MLETFLLISSIQPYCTRRYLFSVLLVAEMFEFDIVYTLR